MRTITFCFFLLLQATTLAAASERSLIVISDLHMGTGRDGIAWRASEDFRWDDEFIRFLAAIGRGGKTDLVINGDAFELWQPDVDPCADPDVGCDEQHTIEHLQMILDAHATTMAALSRFASGTNRIILIPGNHDAGILFEGAQKLLKERLKGAHVSIVENGYYQSEDRQVYIEHGHQADSFNKLARWPRPFVVQDRIRHLERPWGEHFLQAFFNRFEGRYPVVDNIVDERDAVAIVLAAERSKAIPDLAQLGKFLFCDTTFRQRTASMLTGNQGGAPDWDLAQLRREGDAALVRFLRDPLRTVVMEDRTLLPAHMSDLSDGDLQAMCDSAPSPKVGLYACPVRSLGGLQSVVPTAATLAWQIYLDGIGTHANHPAVIVLSHTHAATAPHPEPTAHNWQPSVVNAGAWQRVISSAGLERLATKRGTSKAALIARLRPEDLPACYSFAVVPRYEGAPVPVLRFWTLEKQAWVESDHCHEAP